MIWKNNLFNKKKKLFIKIYNGKLKEARMDIIDNLPEELMS